MSLSNFFFGDLEEDPIFGHTMNSMRQMQNHMMSNMLTDPFRMFGMPGLGGFGGAMAPHRMLQTSPFPGMNMNLNRLLSGGPENGGVSYSSSSVFSVMSSGSGRPQVYQETSSVKQGPGGIKEVRRTVQEDGVKKMAIGHHIGERGHIIEKEQNMHTGEREEREDFINLEEEDTEEFEKDFEHKSRQIASGGRQRCQIEEISSQPLLAIQSSEDIAQHQQQQHQHRNRLAITPRRSYTTRPSLSPLALQSTSSRHEIEPSLHPHPYNPQSRKNRSSKVKGQHNAHHH